MNCLISRRTLVSLMLFGIVSPLALPPFVAHANAEPKAISVGVLKTSASAAIFIAKERGYFEAEGLKVELKFFDAAQPVAVAVASGDVDFGAAAFTAGFYNLAGRGALKVIGGLSREVPRYPLVGYFASTAAAKDIKVPADFSGKRIGVTQVGSSFHYALGILAKKYKFDLAKVTIVPLQSLSNVAAALKGGTIDGALLPGTMARPLIESGGAKLVGWVGDETPWQLGSVFASAKTAENEELSRKFLKALFHGARDYHDVVLATVKDGKAADTSETRPLLEIVSHYTGLTVAQLLQDCVYVDPDGRLDLDNVKDQIDWLKSQGFADANVTLDAVVAATLVKPD